MSNHQNESVAESAYENGFEDGYKKGNDDGWEEAKRQILAVINLLSYGDEVK